MLLAYFEALEPFPLFFFFFFLLMYVSNYLLLHYYYRRYIKVKGSGGTQI